MCVCVCVCVCARSVFPCVLVLYNRVSICGAVL